MKKVFFSIFLFMSLHSYSQLFDGDTSFGISVGLTNYITDTDFLFSKSGTGFTVGLVSKMDFNDRSELLVELSYARHFVKLIGREDALAVPEDLKFDLENFNTSALFNYNYLVKDEYQLGVIAGPSLGLFYEYKIVDDSKAGYVLDPLLATPNDLLFDTRNEQISLNTFFAFGLTAQYNDMLMANFRYYYGLSDPYRNAPVVAIIDLEGKDSYFAFTLSYLW